MEQGLTPKLTKERAKAGRNTNCSHWREHDCLMFVVDVPQGWGVTRPPTRDTGSKMRRRSREGLAMAGGREPGDGTERVL